MNRTDFLNMIEDTVPVNRHMIGEVYELIDIFPYFQSAHMLLLKGLQNSADIKFEKQLKNSAIHIADREVLYYLLRTKPPTGEVTRPISEEVTATEEISYDTQQTVIESAKNSEQLIDEFERDSAGTSQDPELEKESVIHGHSILVASEPDDEDSSGAIIVIDSETLQTKEKIYFMDPGIEVPDYSDLLELDLSENKTYISEEFVIEIGKPEYEEKTSRQLLQSELIDKFIISNPRITPNKDKSGLLPDDISKPVVEEEGGFITETLAKIYTNQGYYSKAIDIYEKLSLKFPEKSSYFASQIEKVKEHIKK
jgi:hypothetical protein